MRDRGRITYLYINVQRKLPVCYFMSKFPRDKVQWQVASNSSKLSLLLIFRYVLLLLLCIDVLGLSLVQPDEATHPKCIVWRGISPFILRIYL